MAKAKSRLLIHHAKDAQPPGHKFTTLSNTAKRLRKVFTSAPLSSTPPNPDAPPTGSDGLASSEIPIDHSTELGTSSDADTQQPAGGVRVRTKAKRYLNSDAPLLTWRGYRDQYLDACLALDGRGRHHSICATFGCQQPNPTFRCQDCFGNALHCKTCIIQRHYDHPLHVIQGWKNSYFQRTTLKSLGLRVQLGHQAGQSCPFRIHGHKDFVVIHVNGIHIINVDFCCCDGAPSPREQLLEVGWWPSTPLEPQSVASMAVLRSFHVWNLQGQVTPTDFYRGLEQLTCGDGLTPVPDRLAQWTLMVREWRHIKMTKRAGRGHHPTGISGTSQGELTIPCRPCPHPGINLPDGWEKEPRETRWLYTLMLSVDANFKQKARLRSDVAKDPPLGPGWGTFVENRSYLEHVARSTNQDEISHCVGFAAIWEANKKQSKGLRATGIGSVSCARHELYRPNGTGDLQKGERYSNMDYLFFASIVGIAAVIQLILASYDIACQWGKNLRIRMNTPAIPESFRLPTSTSLQLLVPKFHLPPHVPKCHGPFSFNFTPGVGRTDGEGVERNWSVLNGIAPSVSQMGPGGRWDTIDDVCNYANWRKMVVLPSMLLRKMSLAIPEAVIHHRALSAFTESLRAEHADHLVEWEIQVRKWEADHSLPCPYEIPDEKITFAKVKCELSQEEHERVEKGNTPVDLDDTSPSMFIIAALELEETQQLILVDLKGSVQTFTQQTAIQQRRTNLLKKIQKFIPIRHKYMPQLNTYLAGLSSASEPPPTQMPECIPLHFPSSLPREHRSSICTEDLVEIEDRLRFAQVNEALTKLRCQLMKRTYASQYKVRNISSQRYYTRFRALQEQTETKIKIACLQYNTARGALLRLRGPGSWEQTLRELHPEDVRGLSEKALIDEEKEVTKRTRKMAGVEESWNAIRDNIEDLPDTTFECHLAVGEGHRTLSWIWYSTTGNDVKTNLSMGAYLRVEWLKCRARAARWKEEIQLLEEEMRRSLQFCAWKAKWWEEQAVRRTDVPPHLSEGLVAYAAENAAAERRRLATWSNHWAAVRERAGLILENHLKDKEEDTLGVAMLEVEVDPDDGDDDLMVDWE